MSVVGGGHEMVRLGAAEVIDEVDITQFTASVARNESTDQRRSCVYYEDDIDSAATEYDGGIALSSLERRTQLSLNDHINNLVADGDGEIEYNPTPLTNTGMICLEMRRPSTLPMTPA